MNVALIGATGFIGGAILSELLSRGHAVTAVLRDPDAFQGDPAVRRVRGEIADPSLAQTLAGHDAVISSVQFTKADPSLILEAVRTAAVPRYLVVGGAGTLTTPAGGLVMDAPDFPKEWLPEPKAAAVFLGRLRQETKVDWTFLSPSAHIFAGAARGSFRLGRDDLLVAEDGKSSISTGDYAIALVDELETPRHSRVRFTVGY